MVGAVGKLNQTTVGQIATGKGIAYAVIHTLLVERVFARKLRVVSGARRIVVFHVVQVVGLGIKTHTLRIAVFDNLVGNVFPLEIMPLVARFVRKIEHAAQTNVVRKLVVGGFSQRHVLVVGNIVRTIERVLHIQNGLVRIGRIECAQQAHRGSFLALPCVGITHIGFKVGNGHYLPGSPIVVKGVARYVYAPFKTIVGVECGRRKGRMTIGGGKFAKVGLVVHPYAYAHIQAPFDGLLFGVN